MAKRIKPVEEQHFAAVTSPEEIGGILRAIDGYKGTFVVRSAFRLAPLVFVRPGELRKAKWADMDLDEAEWTMKLSKREGRSRAGTKFSLAIRIRSRL
jgi:integrase